MVGDATGITNAWNCIQNPSWGQCLEAAGKLLLTASAIATDGGTLELEGGLEAAAEDTSGATTQIFRNVDAREFESITSRRVGSARPKVRWRASGSPRRVSTQSSGGSC